MDELQAVLARGDAKGWDTPWSDARRVEGFRAQAESELPDEELLDAWPRQWFSGALAEGEGEFDSLRDGMSKPFPQLLDALLDEAAGTACLFRLEWLALVPREDEPGLGRAVGCWLKHRGAEPLQSDRDLVPWQWWRPFVLRARERAGARPLPFESMYFLDIAKDITDPANRARRTFEIRVELAVPSPALEPCLILRAT